MNNLHEAVHEVVERRVLPWVERDGVSKLILPEQITPDDCVKKPNCDRDVGQGHCQHNIAIGLSGQTPYCIDKKAFVFTPGRIMLVPSGTPYTTVETTWWRTMKFDPAWSHCVLWFTVYAFGIRVQVSHALVKTGAVETTHPYILLDRHFSQLTTELLEEFKSRQPRYAEIGRCILMEFMQRCLRAEAANPSVDITFIPAHRIPHPRDLSESGLRRSRAKKGGGTKKTGKTQKTPKKLPARIQTAQNFIHSNYYTSVGMNDIAAAANMSVDYFGREFKAAIGITPIQYLLNVRMEAARELILTDLKIADVARMVGIEDPYYFSRVFSKANGASPLKYRKKMAKVVQTGPSVRK